jgi:hypothetical protein
MNSETDVLTGDKLFNATLTGLTPALLEGLLIYFADPKCGHWMLIQSMLFWFSCGFAVHLIDTGRRKIVTSILLTVLLNLPWYIALTVTAGNPNHLIPLVIASIVMGTIIGLISGWLNSKHKR